MAGIFLSYRRDDSSGHAGRLYDRLSAHFGRDRVFRDLDSLGYGTDFRRAIREAVSGCDSLVAVIGREWLTISRPGGGHRLDDPRDFVRMEIEAALERGIPVIPVLVEDAEMPREDDLPVALVRLCQYNGLEVSDSRWDYDVGRLVSALEQWTPPGGPTSMRPPAPPPSPVAEAPTRAPRSPAPPLPSVAPPARSGAARKRKVAIPILLALLVAASGLVALVTAGGDKDDDSAPGVEVVVGANKQWTETPLRVTAGQTVSVNATGRIRDDVPRRPNRVFGPDGRTDPPNSIGDPLPRAGHGSLLGRVDGGPPFLLGAHGEHRPDRTGVLWLGVNDAVVGDNDGSYRVILTVRDA